MSLKANIIGLLAVPLLLAACSGANNFAALQSDDSGTSAANYEFDTMDLPDETVIPQVEDSGYSDDSRPTTTATTETPDSGSSSASNDSNNSSGSAGTTNTTDSSDHSDDSAPKAKIGRSKLTKDDVAEAGFLKPTIYYFPIYNEDTGGCADSSKVNLYDASGKTLMRVCPKSFNSCGLQGACSIIQKGKMRILNIWNRIKGQDRYLDLNGSACRFGLGVKSICLDPFYTLAADLRIYKPGDVIFVPAVVGTVLPSGTIHDGFFIIRDKGRAIKGAGRFDFFTGLLSWVDNKNPFAKLGLGDKKNTMQYFKIKGPRAKEILSRRVFPSLPTGKTTH